MSEMLNDSLNLEILENICSGTGVSVNISALSKSLNKHRLSIKTQLDALFEHEIITKPFYPFRALHDEYPLFTVVWADLPWNKQVERFLVEDENVFAAFRAWNEDYNTLIFEFHKDMFAYYQWKQMIVDKWKIPPRGNRAPADLVFFNNKLLLKYMPNSSVYCMEKEFKNGSGLEINGLNISDLGFAILKKLLEGEGIKTNENLLAQKLKTHRSTIEKRISNMIKQDIINMPICKFPKFFVPPNFVLVFCMIRVNTCKKEIFQAIKKDCNVPLAFRGHTGKYNLAYFGTFPNVEQHFKWEETYHERFLECFGAMKKVYLSPQMTASIDQQKVSLGVIRKKKELLRKG